MQAADNDHIVLNFEPQCVWKLFEGAASVLAEYFSIAARVQSDLVQTLIDAVKEGKTEALALPLVPLGSFVYIALSDSGEENLQRG
jgi:hypothetical protein